MQAMIARDAARPDQEFADPYDIVRALLTARGADDRGIDSAPAVDLLRRCRAQADRQLWSDLPGEAEHHGVAPLLAPLLARLPVPEEVGRAFGALVSRQRRAAGVREQCIDELLAGFAAAGIQAVLLKGAALAHLIYPGPALRPMADIDVLVDPADAERAAAVARRLGFSFAAQFDSRFTGRMHHLPAATAPRSGFPISLELHLDAIAYDLGDSLTLATLTETPRTFRRGEGPDGSALGHTDMLRHLTRHTFARVRRVRLIHLYDLARYQAKFRDAIDWRMLAARFPHVPVALRLVDFVFAENRTDAPAGIGCGMTPLTEIAVMRGAGAKLAALFNPPAWWLHGFYGVPPEQSLLACRFLWHPLTVARWLGKRLVAGAAPQADFKNLGRDDRIAGAEQ